MGGWQVTEDERQRLETSNRQHQDRLQKLDSQRASPRTLLDVSASAPLPHTLVARRVHCAHFPRFDAFGVHS